MMATKRKLHNEWHEVDKLRKQMEALQQKEDISEDHFRKINILSVRLHNARQRCYPNSERAMSYAYELPIQLRNLLEHDKH